MKVTGAPENSSLGVAVSAFRLQGLGACALPVNGDINYFVPPCRLRVSAVQHSVLPAMPGTISMVISYSIHYSQHNVVSDVPWMLICIHFFPTRLDAMMCYWLVMRPACASATRAWLLQYVISSRSSHGCCAISSHTSQDGLKLKVSTSL